MDVDEKFYSALKPLPCPVSQPPGDATKATYVTFNEIDGRPTGYASNTPRRVNHLVQVHIFTKKLDGTARDLQKQATALLSAAGIKVQGWKYDNLETKTNTRHLATTCEWAEKAEV